MSAAFAVVSDLALMMLGGAFKRKEKLSGRFADALGYMFYCSAVLKKFEDDGRPQADLPLVEWSAKYCLDQVQVALDEILRNFPSKTIGLIVRLMVFPLGMNLRYPNDALGHKVASILLKPGEARDRLTKGVFISEDEQDLTGRLEVAMKKVILADPIEKRIREQNHQQADLQSYEEWISALLAEQVITEQEGVILREANKATRNVIMVDEFTPEQMASGQLPTDLVA